MLGGENGLGGDGCGRDIPEVEWLALGALLHAQHLIEIAVEDLAFVADVDGVAAHQALDGGGVEMIDEQLIVVVPLALLAEVGSEAGDREIGDGEEAGEDDAEVLLQLALVIGF